LPDHPATRSTDRELSEAESNLDVEQLVGSSLEATDVERDEQAVPWHEIPTLKSQGHGARGR
jgi:hypothetical protein